MRNLIAAGARFDHDTSGEIALTREGGHLRDRIAHAGGDATGAEIFRALVAAIADDPGIELVQHALALDLLTDDRGGVQGITLHVIGEGQHDGVGAVLAPAVVIATGGLGQVFAQTTNPAVATGDGMALALRAGAEVADLEFVQFHPTVMYLGPDSTGPAAAGQRGRARRGRLPRRRRRASGSCRAAIPWPTSPPATSWPRRSPAGCASRAGRTCGSTRAPWAPAGRPGSRRSWSPAAGTGSTRRTT